MLCYRKFAIALVVPLSVLAVLDYSGLPCRLNLFIFGYAGRGLVWRMHGFRFQFFFLSSFVHLHLCDSSSFLRFLYSPFKPHFVFQNGLLHTKNSLIARLGSLPLASVVTAHILPSFLKTDNTHF